VSVSGALAQRLEQGTHNYFEVTLGNRGLWVVKNLCPQQVPKACARNGLITGVGKGLTFK
jgi:hypothetical protein